MNSPPGLMLLKDVRYLKVIMALVMFVVNHLKKSLVK